MFAPSSPSLRFLIASSLLGLSSAAPPSASHSATWLRPADAFVDSAELTELSGMVVAGDGDSYWAHNDSGHAARLFRFDRRGRVLQTVTLDAAANLDFECMTRDGAGCLVVADVGDNARRRPYCTLYTLPEPAAGSGRAAVTTRTLTYPDGTPRNCEAMFALGGRLYFISKEISPWARPALFALDHRDPADASEPRALRAVGHLDLHGYVTDAAFSAELGRLAVLTYGALWLFDVAEEADLTAAPAEIIFGRFGQCEALCFDGDAVVVTNEPGALWRIPLRDRRTAAAARAADPAKPSNP